VRYYKKFPNAQAHRQVISMRKQHQPSKPCYVRGRACRRGSGPPFAGAAASSPPLRLALAADWASASLRSACAFLPPPPASSACARPECAPSADHRQPVAVMGTEASKCSAPGGRSMLQGAVNWSKLPRPACRTSAPLVPHMCLCASHPPPQADGLMQRHPGEQRRAGPGRRPGGAAPARRPRS